MTTPFEVLIIDDEPGDVGLTRLALEQGGVKCHISVAHDGIFALELLKGPLGGPPPSYLPDLVLLDLNMPRVPGLEVLKAMRTDPRLMAVPVVILTTSAAESDIKRAYASGASGYVVKPIELRALFESIQIVKDYWFNIVRRPHHPTACAETA